MAFAPLKIQSLPSDETRSVAAKTTLEIPILALTAPGATERRCPLIQTELSDAADWHSHATRIVYREFLKRWIRMHWGSVGIRDVRTVAVERWLKQLRRVNGERLADATKAKIRNLMSRLV